MSDHHIYAKVIADSTSVFDGTRMTTLEVRLHRWVLAELNTHRVLSKNSASSRARPIGKVIDDIRSYPAIPVEWPAEKSGMQGGEPVDAEAETLARRRWDRLRSAAIQEAMDLRDLGIHKSIVNRILEPYSMHTVVLSGVAFENFYAQRVSPLAQPEIRVAAGLMQAAMDASTPNALEPGQWHRPYLDEDTIAEVAASHDADEAGRILSQVSAARCARTSYLTQDGRRDYIEDLRLFERLTTAQPAHWSPLEHVATPWPENRQDAGLTFPGPDGDVKVMTGHLPRVGNLLGWRSLRTEIEALQEAVTYR